MKMPFEQLFRVLLYEAFRHRRPLVFGFLLLNAVALTVAVMLPPTYESSSTIFVEQKNIIQPLMQGAAVSTDVRDQAGIAREIIYNRKLMMEALTKIGLLHKGQTDIVQEKIIDAAKDRTRVTNVGANLIRIDYKDRDPNRAYKGAQEFTALFIGESLASQTRESEAAFDFINKQVGEYHDKLTHAEQALKEFRSQYVDARPGTGAEVAKRVDKLEADIEKATLALTEAKITEKSIEKQLSGEAEVSVNLTRESQYTARIAELQSQLETLRLTYRDTYPDIIRIRHEIEDLKEALASARREREQARLAAGNRSFVDESVRANPLYQKLKQQLFDTHTNIQTLEARLGEKRSLLRDELNRATRVHAGEATLAELTRDYEVNRDIYQDLLRRRENARVSRNLDRDKKERTLRVHEPAFLPVQPSGIPLKYIAAGGFILSIGIPLGILYGFVQLDPRIRFESIISKRLKLPLLTVVPHLWAPSQGRAISGQLQWVINLATLAGIGSAAYGILHAMGKI